MAKGFCLPKNIADNLKAQAIAGKIDIAKMYNMTSQERSSLFETWVDKETAKQINAGFEEAMISEQQTALRDWAKQTFSGSEKVAGKKKDIIDKIDRLSELGVLTPQNSESFLSDLVAIKLGVTITAQEASEIATRASKLQELAKETSEFGTPTTAYFKAREDIENYIQSINPSSNVKVATSIIGRGSMLASFKSPALNIESNTIQAFLTAFERRVRGRTIKGANSEYANEYIGFVNKVYKESGYDISRMRSLKGDQKIRGERITTAQGKGGIRKIARVYEDIVFKNLMGFPDVAFSAMHFADSANLSSTLIAKTEGLKGTALKERALAIFKDATSISPRTPEGVKVREQAIADAEYATYTNDSTYSDVALGIRKILNIATGDLRLGDQLMPFVKTPANVVGAGVDLSGVVLPIDTLIRVSKTINAIYKGETVTEATLNAFDGYSKKLVRAGLGTTLALIISGLFEPEDFIGEYPVSQKERELLELQNATTNSVRIGNKWVSLDYFGAIGTPLVAMLYAKKYGNDTSSTVYSYYVGAGRQLAKIPGLELGKDFFEVLNRTKFEGIDAIAESLSKGSVDFVKSRTIPAIVYDLAKALDDYERVADKKDPFSGAKSSIPKLREELPIRRTILGEGVKTEGALSTLLFGSRVKTAQSSPVIDEITRLSETGNLPSITDYAKTSERFKELKTQIGNEKFEEAEIYLGTSLNEALTKEIKSKGYLRANDEDKAERINKIKQDLLDKTLKKYKYKKTLKGSK